MAAQNQDYLVEQSYEQQQIPRDFLKRSPTPSPTEENENDMLMISTPSAPLVSRDENWGRVYGSTSPSPPPSTEADCDQIESAYLIYDTSVRCACHEGPVDKTSRKARFKLVVACIIALVFVIGEIVGGYFSSSLAILTDAAHMLSDFASFLISLFSIWMASRPPSKRMSFGWHRAEVIGAIISVLIIWLVTGVLCYEAVMRIIRDDINIDADIMLITACAGVFVNVFMCMVLHQHDHGHGHGHSHGHDHKHEHGNGRGHGRGHIHQNVNSTDDTTTTTNACIAVVASPPRRHWWQRKTKQADNEDGEGQGTRISRRKKDNRNINVRAAFIHVIGDLIQSIGVLIAGYIIKFWPQLKYVDPICTFMFSILVIFTTLNILRDAVLVIMEGVPRHIKTDQVKNDLLSLKNVKHVHSIHVWSLTTSKVALTAHIAVASLMHSQDVLEAAGEMLKHKYGFAHTTLQVEKYQDEMSSCGPCQGTDKCNVTQRRRPS